MTVKEHQANIITLDDAESFEQLVLESPVPVVVDFWAAWCGPCRTQGPILDQLAREIGERIRVVKVNVDNLGGLAQRFGIAGIPTMIVFDQGREQTRLVGLHSLGKLREAVTL